MQLKLFVCVTGVDPLRVYLHQDGLVEPNTWIDVLDELWPHLMGMDMDPDAIFDQILDTIRKSLLSIEHLLRLAYQHLDPARTGTNFELLQYNFVLSRQRKRHHHHKETSNKPTMVKKHAVPILISIRRPDFHAKIESHEKVIFRVIADCLNLYDTHTHARARAHTHI